MYRILVTANKCYALKFDNEEELMEDAYEFMQNGDVVMLANDLDDVRSLTGLDIEEVFTD